MNAFVQQHAKSVIGMIRGWDRLRCRGTVRMLAAHGLIQKVPHTHRYWVSPKGRQVIAALYAAKEADIHKLTKAT
jgi:hypothetical protein